MKKHSEWRIVHISLLSNQLCSRSPQGHFKVTTLITFSSHKIYTMCMYANHSCHMTTDMWWANVYIYIKKIQENMHSATISAPVTWLNNHIQGEKQTSQTDRLLLLLWITVHFYHQIHLFHNFFLFFLFIFFFFLFVFFFFFNLLHNRNLFF